MSIDLDINWAQVGRAADEMVSNFGEDALAEAEKRAKSMRSAGRYTAAVTWESICQLIKDRTPLNVI
ncbi:MAG: hypothetical protein ACR2PZ_26365 [Pseudomonadales bacterium]